MRLSARERDRDLFEKIWVLNEKSFEPNERAPKETLWAHFQTDDIFVDNELNPTAFAFVTERGGPYLLIIAVVSGLRTLGIGTTLLEEIHDFYTLGSEPYITLTCSVENWRAQRLYLKMGYRAVRVIPKYYRTEDGLMMRRMLC